MKLPFTLKQLRILKAIASKKNFTKAAEMLFISQPTLSKQLQILESQLGIALIDRRTKIISLTEAGQLFLQYSERILSLCEESCRTLNDIKNEYRGSFILGTNKTLSNYLIPRILTLTIKNHPQFQILLYLNSTKKITNHLVHKNIDVGIVSNLLSHQSNQYFYRKNIIKDELVLIISKKKTSIPKTINKDNLYNINFIVLKSNQYFYNFIKKKILEKNKKNFKFIIKLNSNQAVKRSVILGFGLSFITLTKNKDNNQLKILKIEDIKILRKLSIITNSKTKKAKIFEFLVNKFTFYNH